MCNKIWLQLLFLLCIFQVGAARTKLCPCSIYELQNGWKFIENSKCLRCSLPHLKLLSNNKGIYPFEVYLQILVSHSRDIRFLPEVIQDNDRYFLDAMEAIDEELKLRKDALVASGNWSENFLERLKTWQYQTGSSSKLGKNYDCWSCYGCRKSGVQLGELVSVVKLQGLSYDPVTLAVNVGEPEESPSLEVCDICEQFAELFSRIHHMKLHLFRLCQDRALELMQMNPSINQDKAPETRLLTEFLDDNEWMVEVNSTLEHNLLV